MFGGSFLENVRLNSFSVSLSAKVFIIERIITLRVSNVKRYVRVILKSCQTTSPTQLLRDFHPIKRGDFRRAAARGEKNKILSAFSASRR